MVEKIAYLDSSAIVKRYVYETGSEFIRAQYDDVYLGNVLLSSILSDKVIILILLIFLSLAVSFENLSITSSNCYTCYDNVPKFLE